MAQKMDQLQMHMLEKIADLHGVPEGAYNIRSTGRWPEEIRLQILIL